MQGVANQRTIHAQHSYDYSVTQIKNPKNHQILGWQVAVTEQGQGSSQTGASQEIPAYILQISNKDEKGNDVLNQFYKDNGIDPDNVDQTKLEVHQVDEEADRIARKPFDDAYSQAFLGGDIENAIHGMLNPFNDYQEAWRNFGGAAQELTYALNHYEQAFGTDNSYYKELIEKLDTIDPEHKNSAVLYIKDMISRSAGGEHLEFDVFGAQMKDAGQAFDDCFGGLSLVDAKKKGKEMAKAFTKALGESSVEKYFGILLKSKSIKEITEDFIKELNLSKKEDTPQKAESQSDIGLVANHKASQANDGESNEQMAMLKRQLDKKTVGRVVDVEM